MNTTQQHCDNKAACAGKLIMSQKQLGKAKSCNETNHEFEVISFREGIFRWQS